MLYDVKIIQILMAPEGSDWDGKMLGLADDGNSLLLQYSFQKMGKGSR